MASAKTRAIALWTLASVLALLFLSSGYGKLSNAETAGGLRFDEQFVAWGYPAWFRFVVGAAEAAGAIGLLVPRLRFYAAAGLVGVMAGAVGTHIANGDGILFAIPGVLGLLAGAVAWSTRPAWIVHMLGRARRASA